MEQPNIAPGKFGMNYGLILGLFMIILSVISYVTGQALEGAKWPQLVFYVAFPVVIIYAISSFKKKNANILTLGNAIKLGTIIGVISAIVYIIYGLIFNYIIDPEFMGKLMDVAAEKMVEENPNMTQEQIDQSMKIMEFMFNPFLGSAIWIAFSAIFGLIYSLIGGLIMKNEQ